MNRRTALLIRGLCISGWLFAMAMLTEHPLFGITWAVHAWLLVADHKPTFQRSE